MSEFEPGTLAVATVRGVANVRIVRTASSRSLWFSAEQHGDFPDGAGSIKWHGPNHVADVRRLPVIDPEDLKQVERLIRLQDKHFDGAARRTVNVDDLRDMQAALREFANPTPPEPTTVGAIVTDGDGEQWVRYACGEWACLQSRPGDDMRTWGELVAQYGPLSKGVTNG